MATVGYELVRSLLRLTAFPARRPAMIGSVTRIERHEHFLAVPGTVAPATDDLLSHLLFALKHEGVNMQVLAQALPHIPASRLHAELAVTPNGQYLRMVCYLWEALTHRSLGHRPDMAGGYVELFDPQRYITGPPQRNSRWRVDFNGLGSVRYCASVERTPAIEAAMASDILGRARSFTASLDKEMMDRALAWAYLHETEDSYAIEREAPSADKARTFISLLKQAHDGAPLTEDYLVDLQSSVVSNPFDKAVQFRTRQNWLRGPMRGASGVTYVPPPPELVDGIMDDWMAFANTAPKHIDAIVAASIASFGFVFIHPFMDGNGRLSRFLFHQALCTSGQLPSGMLLPVSVAMKRHEKDYLGALQHYSRAARECVNVTWLGDDNFDIKFNGDASIFRYWDATPCVEFGFRMAEQALDVELRNEARFLANFDAVKQAVDERHDVRGSVLSVLISICLQADGVISKGKRKRYADAVPAPTFDLIERITRRVLAAASKANSRTAEAQRYAELRRVKARI